MIWDAQPVVAFILPGHDPALSFPGALKIFRIKQDSPLSSLALPFQ